jgi:nucleotide-binding universal stress UspA family protein
MGRIRRVLHASDFSPASRAAFTRAVDMAKDNRAELLLVHVLTPVMPIMAADGYIPPKTYEDIEASTRAAGQKQLAALTSKARKAGARVKALLTDGAPHEQIIRLARSKHADVVVLGTHGRTGLAKFFLGSVAGRVVSMSPVPVMTVRGK